MPRPEKFFVVFLLALALINFSTSTKCEDHTSCTQCVTSSCNWCSESHRCSDNLASGDCFNDIIISGVNNNTSTTRNGPEFCAAIKTAGDNAEILVPQRTKKRITVKIQTRSLPWFIVQSRLKCQINIDGNVTSVNGQLLADTIYCDEIHFPAVSGKITAQFNVEWGRDKLFDNPDNVHVVIYDCSSLAEDCENCLNLDSKLRCGWCVASTMCNIQDTCGNEPWIKHGDTCISNNN